MAENFHLIGFITVTVIYPTKLTADVTNLIGKVAEDKKGRLTFHQGPLGALVQPPEALIVFKSDVTELDEENTKRTHASHLEYETGLEAGVNAELDAKEDGGAKAVANAGAKAVVKYNNKDYVDRKQMIKRKVSETNLFSQLQFKSSIPKIGKMQLEKKWRRNDLNLKYSVDKSDNAFQINIDK